MKLEFLSNKNWRSESSSVSTQDSYMLEWLSAKISFHYGLHDVLHSQPQARNSSIACLVSS